MADIDWVATESGGVGVYVCVLSQVVGWWCKSLLILAEKMERGR